MFWYYSEMEEKRQLLGVLTLGAVLFLLTYFDTLPVKLR